MPPEPHLSLVIPAFNEERRLPTTLRNVFAWMERCAFTVELLVVDDGSTDGTASILETFATARGFRVVRLPVNSGKGAAVRAGMLAARGRYRLFVDADLATPLDDVHELLALAARGFDVVVGVRTSPEARRSQPLLRRLAGRVFRALVAWLAPSGISDTQCGFKLVRGDRVSALFAPLVTKGFAFDVELLLRARELRVPMAETSVRFHHGTDSTISPWRHGLRMLLEVIRVRTALRGRGPHEAGQVEAAHA